ncbi:MAG: DUF1972 domain-containing protein [Paludibacter sp.]|nr:DUF1972 domain-containing protein [Paludibacter sp.]
MKKVAIIGSHGLYANYGGWDQLVKNLAERKSENIEYLIFNAAESPKSIVPPTGVTVRRIELKASGFQGLFFDFWSILICFWKVDALLLLGVQGMPILPFLKLFKKFQIISNVGGIEWERPKFGYLSKLYLKFCFNLSFIFSEYVILDNQHYSKFLPKRQNAKVVILPYGGEIDSTLQLTNEMCIKYPFIKEDYFLSISRSLEDNMIDELCESFLDSKHKLVVISNLSSTPYGNKVWEKYSNKSNIVLINGLYDKPELDLVRRECKAYIHTHTLCGTAPSLVEMIIAQRPIISKNNPQNRFTLQDQAFFYSAFSEIQEMLDRNLDLKQFTPSFELCKLYSWNKIVNDYECLF